MKHKNQKKQHELSSGYENPKNKAPKGVKKVKIKNKSKK